MAMGAPRRSFIYVQSFLARKGREVLIADKSQSPAILVGVISTANPSWKRWRSDLPFPLVAIMGVERQTGGKKQMDIHYVQAPAPYSVEENFEGFFPDHDDLTLAQLLQDQETVYQSLQKDAQTNSTRPSNPIPREGPNDRQRHGNSSQTVNAESQIAMDEIYAREIQELENQLAYTSLNRTSGAGTGSSTSSSRGNSSHNASIQITIEEDVDPDNMTYEELQSLGEAIGTKSKGLSDKLISYLPVSTYKTGLFHRRENHEECVICSMTYKNRDKLITLPCQHLYHKSCITKWLKIKKACPVCNEQVFGS
ncbi:hypothetical protein M5K25_007705 [Dendrobium thyrsiflorum]|uniref:RING-type domain-containing protein n=1 Tax=Dendrobium thyrsiflorum TaxID=117978 RepID=A0ABD0VF01_DENTH